MENRVVVPLMSLAMLGVLYGAWQYFDLPPQEALIPIIEGYFNEYGLIVVFLSAILESLFLVGMYYPGSLVIFLSVIFAAGDPLRVTQTVLVVSVGFAIGGALNYMMGFYGWYKVLAKIGLEAEVEKSRAKLLKYGPKAIIGGYWHPGISSIISTSAGVLRMGFSKFILFASGAIIVWNAMWGAVVSIVGRPALNLMGFRFGFIVIGLWVAASIAKDAIDRKKRKAEASFDPSEIVLVRKPPGMTSFDVIRMLRAKRGVRKMGHSGTLDPMAEGLLIIGIGSGTKRLSAYIKLDKTYEAEIKLGERTDTGDAEGRIIEKKDASVLPPKKEVERIVNGLVGIHELPVPAYSAVKQGGVPLYKKARRGEEVEAPIRKMEITGIKLHSVRVDGDSAFLSIGMDVSSGTYVRSVAEELGRRLGLPATLSKLVRTRIGSFMLDQAEDL